MFMLQIVLRDLQFITRSIKQRSIKQRLVSGGSSDGPLIQTQWSTAISSMSKIPPQKHQLVRGIFSEMFLLTLQGI